MAGPTPLPHTSSRRRPPPSGDEEAGNTLKLGEMATAQSISVAEANVLLQAIDEQRKRDRVESNKDIYVKARDYVNLFARFRDTKTVEQIDNQTRDIKSFHHFERAQIATLCCDTAEEARTLVPSLEGKISDDDLQTILDDISKLRDFS